MIEATTNTKLEAMQNLIEAILEELRHLCRAQIGPPIQNLYVAQVGHPAQKYVKDNARNIIKKIKVKAPDFDKRRDLDLFLD